MGASGPAGVSRVGSAPRAKSPREKVLTLDEVGALAEHLRQLGKRIVQAHGAFDLLHLGHVRHLEAARSLGDALIVTITADRFVNKGPGRPVFGAAHRAEMVASLVQVDWVVISDAPDAMRAIATIRPSVYVKGQEYRDAPADVTGKITVEREAVEAIGGSLQFTDEITFSSSQLINRHVNVFGLKLRQHLDGLRQSGALAAVLGLIERVAGFRVRIAGKPDAVEAIAGQVSRLCRDVDVVASRPDARRGSSADVTMIVGSVRAPVAAALIGDAPFVAVRPYPDTPAEVSRAAERAAYLCLYGAARGQARIDRAKAMLVGRSGCIALAGGVAEPLPGFPKSASGTSATDSVFAVTAPLVAAGGSLEHVGFIGNVTRALLAERDRQSRMVEKSSLVKAITGLLK